MPNIFLSHSSLDQNLANVLSVQIRAEIPQANVFVSTRPDAIPSGDDWLEFILNSLNQAEVLIPLITPHSVNSMWVAFEYGYFWHLKGKTAIFPLFHPKAQAPSPLNTIEGKNITEEAELEAYFKDLSKYFGQEFEKRAQLNLIVEVAKNLSMLTSADREKQADGRRQLKATETIVAKQSTLEWMQMLDILHDASLQWIGDLRGIKFISANMQRIDLGGNDLRGANFWGSHLEDARLGSTQLQGADFLKAHLEGASLQGANLDGTTTLPDGTKYKPELGLEQLKNYGIVIDR